MLKVEWAQLTKTTNMPKQASWKGQVIASSTDTVTLEGNVYFPASDVDKAFVVESDHHSTCPWKGRASYYHLEVAGERNENAAWYYADPKPAAVAIKGRVAFWRGVEVENIS
jgi:uncharacterized protein (DUF427 family)